MDTSLSDDDVERIRSVHPANGKEHVERARRLLKRAEPGNVPFRILEQDYGFVGDYTEADHGMHWSDNN